MLLGLFPAQVIALPGSVYEGDGFQVEYSVFSNGGNAYSAEVNIINTGTDPVPNWALGFDFPGSQVTNIWNGSVASYIDDFLIVKNTGWNAQIAPNATVNFGFQFTSDDPVNPETFEICEAALIPVPDATAQFNLLNGHSTGFFGQIVIANNGAEPINEWQVGFDFTGTIENVDSGSLVSQDGDTYLIRDGGWNAVIQPNASATVTISGSGNGTYNFSNAVVYMTQFVRGDSLDWRDSDGDELPNWMEDYLGTDKNNPDTDDDDLPDGYEVLTLDSDPLTPDSDLDFDEDGLTNLEEYLLGTKPLNPDTDVDDLSDGDEVNVHGTDPLKPDTDDDNVWDGDEVLLGLDPLNPETFGYPDADYKVTQVVEPEKFSNVNTDKFEVSVEINAAGNAKRLLSANESTYSDVIQNNPAILGKIISLEYTDLEFDSATINFKIGTDYAEETGSNYAEYDSGMIGIQRYQLFRFDEENNILCPIETEYDIQNDLIFTETDTLGNYCVIDLEQWFYNLGIPAEEPSPPSNIVSFAQSFSDSAPEPFVPNKQVDIMFVIDTSGSMGDKIERCKTTVGSVVSELYSLNVTANVAVVSYSDYINDGNAGAKTYKLPNNSHWATTPDEANNLLSQVTLWGGGSETTIDGLETARQVGFRDHAMKFMVLVSDEEHIYNQNRYGISNLNDMASILRDDGIITSVVCNNSHAASFAPLYERTNGVQIDIMSNFDIWLKAFLATSTRDWDLYQFLVGANLDYATLNAPIERNSQTDSDRDGLTDSQEINWDYIQEINGALVLPTLEYYTRYDVEEIFSRLRAEKIDILRSLVVLPIKSHPGSEDGDKDGVLDPNDYKPLDIYNNYRFTPRFTWQGSSVYDEYPETVTLLQKGLERIGFLDMHHEDTGIRDPYGAYGGRTRGAVVDFQLNYGFEPTGEADFYTYAAIVNQWTMLHHEIDYGHSSEQAAEAYHNYMTNAHTDFTGDEYFIPIPSYKRWIPAVAPKVSDEMQNQGVTVTELYGKYYYDYTTPINALINRNKSHCEERNNEMNIFSWDVFWFRRKVDNDAEWDIKRSHRWEEQLPGILHLTEKGKFLFRGKSTDAEAVGNIHYGYLGKFMNFSNWTLYTGAGVAASGTDDKHDRENIDLGIAYYNADHGLIS